MRVKEESEKPDLKLNNQKTKIMPFGPITSFQIEGEKWKQWQIFFSWALKLLRMVTVAMKSEDNCFLAGKDMTNLDDVFKSRDITLLTKVHIVKWSYQ